MLTACRECGQPVSTEAAACPHCGISSASPAPASTDIHIPPDKKRPLVAGAVIAAVAVLAGGFMIGKSQGWFPTGVVDSGQVAASISARYSQITGQHVQVHCPRILQQKGKISDCTATRPDTGASTRVFVTQIDDGGHFTFQPEDVSVLIGGGGAATEPTVPDGSREPVLSADDAAKQNDKGWVLEDYTAGGSQSVAARIKNANAQTSTAFFTMTLLNAGTVVATWHGSATSVEPGAVVTVTMLTADTIPAGVKADDMQFQTDTSIGSG